MVQKPLKHWKMLGTFYIITFVPVGFLLVFFGERIHGYWLESIVVFLFIIEPIVVLIIALMERKGLKGMLGKTGVVKAALSPKGKVFVHGVLWNAKSKDGSKIETGIKVKVLKADSEELVVRPE